MAAAAVHVFGNPITNGTRQQRALAAKNNQNADGKFDQVLRFASQNLKAVVAGGGTSTVTTTFGRVYNATGVTVTYVTFYDWDGKVVGSYPTTIQNGQWAVFQHSGTARGKDSIAAVVYNFDDFTDAMIAWNNPWKSAQVTNNTAYCEMKKKGYFLTCDWTVIKTSLLASGTSCNTSMEGYATKVSIDAGTNIPTFTAHFSIDV